MRPFCHQRILGRDTGRVAFPALAAQIYARHCVNRSPILDSRGVGAANAGAGLRFFAYSIHRDEAVDPTRVMAYGGAVSDAFWQIIRGYHLREAFVENYSMAARNYMARAGYAVISDDTDSDRSGVSNEHRLFLVQLTRNEARGRQGEMVPSLVFPVYNPPRFGFTPKEQEMLEYALEEDTESFLAARCGYARITIKQRWRCIYDRVDAV